MQHADLHGLKIRQVDHWCDPMPTLAQPIKSNRCNRRDQVALDPGVDSRSKEGIASGRQANMMRKHLLRLRRAQWHYEMRTPPLAVLR